MTTDGCVGTFATAGTVGVAFALAGLGECFFGATVAFFFRPGPKGWCLITCGAVTELLPWPSMVIPPPRSTAARSASAAAYRTGGESVKVTESLSAAKRGDLKDKGRGFPRPLI